MIGELLFAPGDQGGNAHYWASVALAHAMLGLCMAAMAGAVGARQWAAVGAVAAVYGVWEGWHWYLSGDWQDSLVDWAAVMSGAVAGLAAWERRRGLLGVTLAGLLAGLAVGIRRRRNDD